MQYFKQNIHRPYVLVRRQITSNNIWIAITIVAIFLSFFRGIRYPSIWTYSHYLFNYDYGFTKRALIGAILSYIDATYMMSYEVFFLFSIFLLLASLSLLCAILIELIKVDNIILTGTAFIFSCSLVFAYLAHIIGYSDIIGLMITLVAIRIESFWNRIAFIACTMPIALLIHEGLFVIFSPFCSFHYCSE